ncbi:conserved hypothetical protein [Beutenbergia cavernae DSM 12333]|uniref:Integral membrane protein n=1 Tax=Beutenbergia cavernae (strain ATCC BAA-8 / DSM 12333 / CCUG 43141 / JCM 11478 / NBRC 16432 / NCIMB 13614 / HKI 0122) TaxID=471853 RepID=C5BVJ7_BEUC1|nr:hypothetical protein [Beutenbergia cavernae]ACQ78437.1 conserved hypothetical protein [Beutenbergia cavernae DSM 12333]
MGAIPEGWGEFGVAAAGATAALAGLLIVAMSVNVAEILATRAVVAGARSTIASLVLAIATSLLLLPPGMTLVGLGVATLVLTGVAIVIQVVGIAAQWTRASEGVTGPVRAFIVALAAVEHVPFLVGGILLVAGLDAGLWGIVAGMVAVVVVSMVNAWALLIEVRR